MAERIDLLIRAALHAIALLFPTGKVTIIEHVGESGNADVVNVDVTGRPELREQLAEAIIECDTYHVHEPECFPWERWTTDRGEVWRGMVGKLLTMWVRVEEMIGNEPVASDPATVVAPIPAPAPAPARAERWIDTGSGPGTTRPAGELADRDPVTVRPYVTALQNAASTGALGIARVDGDLSAPPTEWPPRVAPVSVEQQVAQMNERHPLVDLVDDAHVLVIPGDTAEAALRRWVPTAIETELRRGGPFDRRTDALAAIRSHPAAEMIDEETALTIAETLVRPIPRPRAPWWTLGGILGGAQ